MNLNEIYIFLLNKDNTLTLVFGLIGLIGTFLAILTWRSHKKTKQIYDYLFNIADKNIEKDITEAEISKKKDEVEIASMRISELQEQIRKDIPIEAKRAVLKDRLNSQIEQLKLLLDSTKIIQKNLNKIGESSQIPSEIFKAIENEISPEYIIREKRSNLKTILMMITTAAAISSTLLPYPLGRGISWFVLLLGVPVLISLIKTMPRNQISQIKIIQYSYLLFFIGSMLLIFIGIIFLIFWKTQNPDYFNNIPLYLAIMSFILAIFSSMSGIFFKQGIGRREALKYISKKIKKSG